MTSSIIEYQVQNAVKSLIGNNAGRIVKIVNKIAAKQGGLTMVENYQLLGKRVAIGVGVVAVGAQAVAFIITRRNENKRIEKIARRVVEEELQKEKEAEARA